MEDAVDRIGQPWGARTVYGRHESWPGRVDTFLADGMAPASVQRWVQAASILHSDGDAMDIAVADGRMVGVRGREADRVNRGRLGPKDLFGWQANGSRDRLTRPLVRRDGRLVETDWDTAMDLVAAHSRELLEERGPGSIGFYTSGQLFLEEYYTLAVLARGGIGTNHLDGNTRLCTATAGEAPSAWACGAKSGQRGCSWLKSAIRKTRSCDPGRAASKHGPSPIRSCNWSLSTTSCPVGASECTFSPLRMRTPACSQPSTSSVAALVIRVRVSSTDFCASRSLDNDAIRRANSRQSIPASFSTSAATRAPAWHIRSRPPRKTKQWAGPRARGRHR